MKNAYLIVMKEDDPDYPTSVLTNLYCFVNCEKAHKYYKELCDEYLKVLKNISMLGRCEESKTLKDKFSIKYLNGWQWKDSLRFHIETVERK